MFIVEVDVRKDSPSHGAVRKAVLGDDNKSLSGAKSCEFSFILTQNSKLWEEH